jgi:hypothetical protein
VGAAPAPAQHGPARAAADPGTVPAASGAPLPRPSGWHQLYHTKIILGTLPLGACVSVLELLGRELWVVRLWVGHALICPTKHSLAVFVWRYSVACWHARKLLSPPLLAGMVSTVLRLLGVADISSATAGHWLWHAFGLHAYTNEVAVQVTKRAVVAAIENALAAPAVKRQRT